MNASLAKSVFRPADLPRSVHLLGICGTGMTALASGLSRLGVRVSGSDAQVYPPMSSLLAQQGIPCLQGYRAENLPAEVEWVVVGNVIRADNAEALAAKALGLQCISMPQAVRRWLIGERAAACVTGTHGKSTTSSMLAHLLGALGKQPGFLVGGVARNTEKNFALGAAEAPFVIEGDEYDSAYFDKTPKFHKYCPQWLICTSLEFDHADIYADLAAIRAEFRKLVQGMPPEGLVIGCADDAEVDVLLETAPCRTLRYGFSERAELRLTDWRAEGAQCRFSIQGMDAAQLWQLPLMGRYNALNAAAALACAQALGCATPALHQALKSFQGVRRRQEVRGHAAGVTVVDDFAHHPTAVRLTLEALALGFAGRRLWAVFEPRSYTARSAYFQKEFAGAFGAAQRVVFAPPFRGRYVPARASSESLLDTPRLAHALNAAGTPAQAASSVTEILELLAQETRAGDVVAILSNGGFEGLPERLLERLVTREAQESQTAHP